MQKSAFTVKHENTGDSRNTDSIMEILDRKTIGSPKSSEHDTRSLIKSNNYYPEHQKNKPKQKRDKNT